MYTDRKKEQTDGRRQAKRRMNRWTDRQITNYRCDNWVQEKTDGATDRQTDKGERITQKGQTERETD